MDQFLVASPARDRCRACLGPSPDRSSRVSVPVRTSLVSVPSSLGPSRSRSSLGPGPVQSSLGPVQSSQGAVLTRMMELVMVGLWMEQAAIRQAMTAGTETLSLLPLLSFSPLGLHPPPGHAHRPL